MIKKNIVFAFVILINILSYGQKVGIGTNLPTEMLDVNGKVRIRSVEELPGTGIRPLYINSDGIVGRKVEEAPLTQIFSAISKTEYYPVDAANQFNLGNNILAQLTVNNAIVNNLDIVNGGNDQLKIANDGFYFYNSYINLAIGVNSLNKTVYIFARIEYSRDNGASWNILTATRLIVPMTILGGQMVILTLPSTTFKHNQGDLIRLNVSRSRSIVAGRPVLGDPINLFAFSFSNSVPPYTLIINKI